MNVTREVIEDLLPVYYAGDASPATRALVEEFLARDPEYAARVRAEWTAAPSVAAAAPAARPSAELASLRRTRRVLAQMRWLFGIALTCSLLPLSFEATFTSQGVSGFRFLIADRPWVFGPFLATAVICWLLYLRLRRALRVP